MTSFSTWDTTMIIAMVVVYILVTSVASIRLRSRNSEQFMVAGRSMPAVVVAVPLVMVVDTALTAKAELFQGVQ